MFVLCPHCQFLVALEPVTGQPPEQCPRCRERLRDAAQPAPADEPPAVEAVPAAIVEAPAVAQEAGFDAAGVDEPALPDLSTDTHDIQPVAPNIATTQPSGVIVDTAADRDVADAEARPDVARATPTPRVPRSIALPSASARHRLAIASVPLLAMLLLLQSLLADRARLAADARWRPLMTVVCDVLSCTLPPWREPAAFTLLDRDVRPDAHRVGVLHVSAGFRNDARWAQPWPALLLTLSDADGRVAGTRAFRPAEYLAAPATQNRLASGQTAKVSFDVVEPTRDVVAFTFDFR